MWRTTKAIAARERLECISIHVPRVEDDCGPADGHKPRQPFQSTSPVWRTTTLDEALNLIGAISIHVPRVEDDRPKKAKNPSGRNFNPRPPCGGRPYRSASFYNYKKFQSTSPVWRTTCIRDSACSSSHFNPRPPCGGRQQYCTNRMQHHFTQTGCSAYFFFITSFSHRLYHFAAAVFPARMHRDFYVRFTFAESDYQRLGYVKR